MLPYILVLLLLACTVAIWLRNRDILRDLFDYSTVIAAAGKVEAGFRPYTDVRSPMQSTVYVFNWAVEQIFGRNYLGLSVGGLLQALGGGLLMGLVLRRGLGSVGAILIAAAMMLAGLLQHVVFFYNPIGILCFGLIVAGLAQQPRLWPVHSAETLIIYAALLIGGANKINFHGLALVVGGLMIIRAWAGGSMTAATCALNVVLLAVMGLVVPVGLELAWTGASLGDWIAQVMELPNARLEYIHHVLDLGIYLQPVHDFHHHLIFRAMGGFGLALLTIVGAWLVFNGWRSRANIVCWLVRIALLLVCLACGSLLMITNHETVMLTSLSYLMTAVAIYLAYRRPDSAGDGWVRRVILIASLMWIVCGGYAAWHGSRVLYAQNPPPRSEYVRLVSAPHALAYLEGVRIERGGLASLRALAARLESFEDAHGKIHGVLFGPALEWLERAYPETIVRHAPIWYHAGTSMTEHDGQYMLDLLNAHGIGRLVTHLTWQAWPVSVREMLERDYRTELVGSRYIIFHPRRPAPRLPANTPAVGSAYLAPAEFRTATESNVLLPATIPDAGMTLQRGTHGEFFGRKGNSTWAWPFGTFSMQGRAVAHLEEPADRVRKLTFTIIAGSPDQGELLWEVPVLLSRATRDVDLPFSIEARGRPLWLQVTVSGPDTDLVTAGWTNLRIHEAGILDQPFPLPFDPGLQRLERSLPGEPEQSRWFARGPDALHANGWTQVPAENWRLFQGQGKIFRAEIEFEASANNPGDPVVVTLAWYRAGRFEIMTEKMIDLRQTSSVILESGMPQVSGWLGVLTRPAGRPGAGHLGRIRAWEIH